ncbi:MAG: hypothetical protein Q9180_007938, partial [Flavoplaca navasiana]
MDIVRSSRRQPSGNPYHLPPTVEIAATVPQLVTRLNNNAMIESFADAVVEAAAFDM